MSNNKKNIKKKNKIRIKWKSVIIFTVIFIMLAISIKLSLDFKIKNIFINNNSYLTDEYILELSELEDYPRLSLNPSIIVEKRIIKDDFIKDCDVERSFLGVIDINIEENIPILYKEYTNTYILEDLKEVNDIPFDISLPRIINYITDNVYDNFLKAFLKLNIEIRTKISQIKYDPSEYDDSRFLLYMVDGNYVYITLTKIDSLNYYNEIIPTLNNKKGILYLDSGNHFVEI